ncbi:MAG: peptidoglycan editing factor PgeF [Proteobacteria bacterium]|nr:peptidoglycan editing factor PgeF [Pseudomonadota bacterium]
MSLQPQPSPARGLLNADAPPADFSAALAGVHHAFFGRQGGVSQGIYASLNAGTGSNDDPEAVKENRRRIAAAFSVEPTQLVGVHQVHSPNAVFIEAPWPGDRPHADALVTNKPGFVLSILTADCAPVLLADKQAGVVAAAHAGWKGAIGGILDAIVTLMREHGARDITAAIGPCIHQASYEVGPEFEARFLMSDPRNRRFFAPGKDDRRHFDLPGFCASRLEAAGVQQIDILPLDTCALAEHFHSNRRALHEKAGDYGRNCAAIALA